MNFKSTHIEEQLSLQILSRRYITKDIIEFVFCREGNTSLPDWAPGAHIDLKLSNGMNRQYSIMSDETDDSHWKIAVLIDQQGRGGSKFIEENFFEGNLVEAKGPRNHFQLVEGSQYHFIAGGIGITPLIPMIEHVDNLDADWTLSFLGKSLDSMPYLSELLRKYPKNITTFSKNDGDRFDVSTCLSIGNTNAMVYCCGPERLMDEVETFLVEQDKSELVHIERFSPKAEASTQENSAFTVVCNKSGIELFVSADESILMAADFEGIEINGDCMEGTCGSCETQIISGKADHRDSIFTAAEQLSADTMMICVSRAVGSRITLDL